MTGTLTDDDRRRRGTILAKLAAGTLERRPPAAGWHIGPGSGERCHACDELISTEDYKQNWPGARIVVHTGCAQVWEVEGRRLERPS